jgi:hypothetical protein
MTNIVLAKVWPLEPGVMGLAPHDYSPLELSPGTPGFMDYPDAVAAEREGRVQLMAGRGWDDLKSPRTEAKPKAAPKPEPKQEPKTEYRTADMQPAEPKKDTEDAKNEYKVTQLQPKRRPGRPPKNPQSAA